MPLLHATLLFPKIQPTHPVQTGQVRPYPRCRYEDLSRASENTTR